MLLVCVSVLIPSDTRRKNNVVMTSKRRRNVVLMPQWRIIASCARWDMGHVTWRTLSRPLCWYPINYMQLIWKWCTCGCPIIKWVAVIRLNTLRPRQNGRHFPDDIFKGIFLNENVLMSIKISLKFVPKGPINNIPALVQIMAWHRTGDKPLSEPVMVGLLRHICATRTQWVKDIVPW